jgi:hypothetical protein
MRLFTCILLITLSAGLSAQNFTTSTTAGVDLKAFETFAVVKGEVVIAEDANFNKENFHQRIQKAIQQELQLRGYRQAADSLAQLRVSYVVESSSRMDVVQLGPMGGMPTTNPANINMSQDWSREFRQGSLFLEIEDTARKSVIWTAEGVMDASRTRGGNLVDIAVQNAFRKFPDRTKKEKPAKKPRN